MTGSDIDVSAALMSAELQDLMAECTAEKPGSRENVPAGISGVAAPGEDTPAEYPAGKHGSRESIPAGVTSDAPLRKEVPAVSTDTGPAPEEQTGELSDPFANIVIKSTFTDTVFGERGASAEDTIPESASVADPAEEAMREENIPVENVPTKDIPVTLSCSSCGSAISGTTKFCGSCGTAVSPAIPAERAPAVVSCTSCGAGISGRKKFCGSCGSPVSRAPAAESAPVSSGGTAQGNNDTSHSGPRPAAEPVVNLKLIEELDDLSWLTD